ncbi:UxaA family hydrolase [Azospirillum brasilense]|uniref:UxaA family hydrolase n=1 Tax=Azospirillum brasilense TaxID=192 RepID=UPI000E68316E|nr:altronate dehydratase family protein [Azospirillum brasilense]NUB29302.1 altronate dehydratase [Azospirillum brasilense]NUB36124.1 altronate dehydratase [Azospirillum brasilense]RIV97318.1 altronate dehydratase [Azospirillum brasilense]
MASLTIRLHPADNVVVAGADLPEGTPLPDTGVVARTAIPSGHKVAVQAIAVGEPVRKYNQVIGFATAPIAPGDHVHVHNIGVGDSFERDYAFGADVHPTDLVPEAERATFQGIVRPDGRVATRNYIGILTTVNCSATAARMIADQFRSDALAAYPNIDGVVALTHSYGCGMGSQGDAIDALRRTIAGYARHPNFAAVLVLGLGCEVNQIDKLVEVEGLTVGDTLQTLAIQDSGGTAATVRASVERIRALLPRVNDVTRETVPASHLILALQCGGSDGYSGITANPALGHAVDLLIRNGGTAVLSETPEVYGAEHLLTRRAVSPAVGGTLVERIRWWEDYTSRTGGEMNNNPSPGNKKGGLTTILEKSLGAVAKAGTTNLVEVVRYAEPITGPGLVFMDTPGYDPVSATGQVAGGSNVLCFTTGRGSVFGCKPTPSLKLATNTALFRKMPDDMDIDCGPIATGDATIEEVGRAIFQLILDTASGRKTKSEELGFGSDEFTPWQMGAVM